MSKTSISFPEARLAVLCTCETFREELPADITPEDYGQALVQLDLKLSYWLGRHVNYVHLVTATLEQLEQLEQLDNGDHPSMVHTRNGAIDEGGHIRSNLDGMLEDALRDVVNSAGIYATRNELVIAA